MNIKTIEHYFENPSDLLNIPFRKGMLNWLDDKNYLKLQYRSKMGRILNLEKPRLFSEKIQWLKLYDRKERYTQLVDKYEVKQWVANILGEEYIIPTVSVSSKFEEINFNSLPKQFVIKCTHDSGGIVICRDKENFDKLKAKKTINKSLSRNYYKQGREWPYKNVKARVIVEKYMSNPDSEEKGLTDYKFFCFNSKPRFMYVSKGLEDHSTARISFFDLEGRKMPFKRRDYAEIEEEQLNLPENFSLMVEIAENLAATVGSPFVRIDLYNIKGKIYFSEITFSPCSGYMPLEPQKFDEFLGDMLNLNSQ